ncbi:MAG: sulfatase, partial [Planctomycetes bacterium]|nr:sulfatase [Planctomycetota bacterium]
MRIKAAALFLFLCFSAACSVEKKAPNVLLILIDTCRADRMSLYDYAGATTPEIEKFAAGGVVFEQAISHVPQTLPSTATLLTSLLPADHGVRVNGLFELPETVGTLPELFQTHGYACAAIISAFPLDERYGLNRGFDSYDSDFETSIFTERRRRAAEARGETYQAHEQRADETTDKAVGWLKAHIEEAKNAPFFLLVHYFDPHGPYKPPKPFNEKFNGYDGELAYTDQEVGRLFRFVDDSFEREETIVALTGDHGELLQPGDAVSGHAGHLEDGVLHIPLVLRWPG